jgi:hypothetical protein
MMTYDKSSWSPRAVIHCAASWFSGHGRCHTLLRAGCCHGIERPQMRELCAGEELGFS